MLIEFGAGQEWSYSARQQDHNSTVIVLRVDEHEELGEIVHVAVRGVAITNPSAPEKPIDTISHMPMAADSIRGSVTELVATERQLPDYEEGYLHWKEAFESGSAGIFTVSVAEAVEFMEQTLQRGS